MLAGIFGLAAVSALLLCGAGSVPVENFAPQGPMQADLNAGGHSITNVGTLGVTNAAALPTNTTVGGTNLGTAAFTPATNYLTAAGTNLIAGTDTFVGTVNGDAFQPTFDLSQNWNWVQGTAIIPGGASWEIGGTVAPSAYTDYDGTIYVYYAGYGDSPRSTHSSIGFASGKSLTSMTESASNPVLTAGATGAWDSSYVSGVRIFKDDATTTVGGTTYGPYYLYYFGSSATGFEAAPSSIGVAYASSPSGPWTKYASNPVLTPGGSGWDSGQLYRPSVMRVGATYYLYYNANGAGAEQIGVATSSTPVGPWTKYSGNPILSPGGTGQWDTVTTGDPFVYRTKGGYGMLYYGFGGSYSGMSLAAAAAPLGPWVKTTPANIPIYPGNGQGLERGAALTVAGKPVVVFDNNGAILAANVHAAASWTASPVDVNGANDVFSVYNVGSNWYPLTIQGSASGWNTALRSPNGAGGFWVALQLQNTSTSGCNTSLEFDENGVAKWSLNDTNDVFSLYDNVNGQTVWTDVPASGGASVFRVQGTSEATKGFQDETSGHTNSLTAFDGSGNIEPVTLGSGVSYNTSTKTLSAAGTGGTVSSVGLNVPGALYNVGGSPVTGSGSITLSLLNQGANTLLAGPATGSAAAPVFRALVPADIPNNAANTTGTAANVTGTIAVANGGTGLNSVTSGDLVIGNGTGSLTVAAPGTGSLSALEQAVNTANGLATLSYGNSVWGQLAAANTYTSTATYSSTSGNILTVGESAQVGSGGYSLESAASSTSAFRAVYTGAPSSSGGAGIGGILNTIPTSPGQRLGFYVLGALDGTTNRNTVGIEGFSSQAWTSGSAAGSYLQFDTTANGSTVRTPRLFINQSGTVYLGGTQTDNGYGLECASTIKGDTGVIDGATGNTLAKAVQVIASGSVTLSAGSATITNANLTATSKLGGYSISGTPGANTSLIYGVASAGQMILKAPLNGADTDTINYTIIQ
jgi:hypothetical protein